MAAKTDELFRIQRTDARKPSLVHTSGSSKSDHPAITEDSEYGTPQTRFQWRDDSRGSLTGIGIEFDGLRLTVVGIHGRGEKKCFGQLALYEWLATPSRDSLVAQFRDLKLDKKTPVHVVLSTPRGIVRRYRIPQLPRRKRRQAAIWEGKQLVPFLLDDEHALFGFEFTKLPKNEYQVTLVALPRSDAGALLEAFDHVGIPIESIVLSGTQELPRYERGEVTHPDDIDAAVLCSPSRAAFVAFQGRRVIFHYDLGPLPIRRGAGTDIQPKPSDNAFSWLYELRPMISDALDFFTSSHPNVTLTHLHVVGMDEALAPHLTDLAERFPEGIEVVNPLVGLIDRLPDDFKNWVQNNIGTLTPAALAASRHTAIDLKPPRLQVQYQDRRLVQYTRSAFIASAAILVVVTGLLVQYLLAQIHTVDLARNELRQLQNSPPVQSVHGSLAGLTEYQTLATTLNRPPGRWMPWLKTLFTTLPENCRLDQVTAEITPGSEQVASITVRLTGSLGPGTTPHAVSYHSWLTELEQLAGSGNVILEDERRIHWKGRTRSVFSLKLTPPVIMVQGGGR